MKKSEFKKALAEVNKVIEAWNHCPDYNFYPMVIKPGIKHITANMGVKFYMFSPEELRVIADQKLFLDFTYNSITLFAYLT